MAAVSGFLFELGANIVSSHQYSTDPTGGRFFLRTELFLADALESAPARGSACGSASVAEVAERFQMEWELRFWGQRRRMAILVSRRDHCLVDLLWRWRRGELDAEVVAVVSNHPDLEPQARGAGVPFHHVPVEPGGKAHAEARMLELLAGSADLVVLARYMQILSGDFLERVGAPVINIHHSFLPAFPGAEPYRRAREHGVKLIGATAHYVVEELDGGADHRTGRGARRSPAEHRRPRTRGSGYRAHGARPRRGAAPRRPRDRRSWAHGGVLRRVGAWNAAGG